MNRVEIFIISIESRMYIFRSNPGDRDISFDGIDILLVLCKSKEAVFEMC